MLMENEIGINREDYLPGKGKYAVYGTYDRFRRFGEYPNNIIVSLCSRHRSPCPYPFFRSVGTIVSIRLCASARS